MFQINQKSMVLLKRIGIVIIGILLFELILTGMIFCFASREKFIHDWLTLNRLFWGAVSFFGFIIGVVLIFVQIAKRW